MGDKADLVKLSSKFFSVALLNIMFLFPYLVHKISEILYPMLKISQTLYVEKVSVASMNGRD